MKNVDMPVLANLDPPRRVHLKKRPTAHPQGLFFAMLNIYLDGVEKNPRSAHGQYEVRLPFKDNHDIMENKYSLSVKRLPNLWKRFKADRNLFSEYDKIIQDQLKSNVIEHVPCDSDVIGATSYLPHRPVIKENRNTTKTRIVFRRQC